MPDHELTDQVPSSSELTRRALVAGTGFVAVSAALAACSNYGGSAPAAPGGPVAPGGPSTGGQALASKGDIPVGSGLVFESQQVVVTQPARGTFKAFSAICTHQGCTVNTVAGGTINCPCHGSKYAIADGSVVKGPAKKPLEPRQITVSGDSIQLT